MKRVILYIFAAAVSFFALSGCTEKEKPLNITGEWRLSAVETKVSIGSETVDVYLSFVDDGLFIVYQMVGSGRYRRYSGNWTLTGSRLTGKYSDGKQWGASYDVEVDGDNLVLNCLSSSGTVVETDTYRRASIPDSVISNAE